MARKTIILFLAVILLFASGCAQNTIDTLDGLSVTDASGVTVTLPLNPQRVAVLFSSFADIWVSAGGTVAVTVGESVERGFADSDVILVDSGAGKTINTETLLAAKPDLVICSADIDAQLQAAKVCRQAGIPAAAFRVESFQDYLDVLETFTTLTGCPEAFESYGNTVSKKIAELKNGYFKNSKASSILFIRAGSSARSTKAKGSQDHFACQMLQELGTENIADAAPILLDGLSLEEILKSDPDYIFISTMGDAAAATAQMESLLSQPQWQALAAVQNEKVYFLPKDLFQFKPNSRWDEAYKYLIDVLSN